MSLVRGLAQALAVRPDLVALLCLGLIATLPRSGILLRAPIFITNDSLSYLLPGFDLATGRGFEPIYKRPPGYPAFVGGVIWLFGQQDLNGLMLVQHLLGVLTTGLAYLLGKQLFGRPAGWLAGLLTALSGPLLVTEHYLMSETLFGLLLTASFVVLVTALRRQQLGWLAVGGLLLGLAALTRPVAQMLLLPLVLLALWCWPRWRSSLTAIALLLACYAATVLPWMMRNGAVQGSFTLAGGLGEGLAVRTIRLEQEFDFRDPGGGDRLRTERRIYREEARQGSAYELAARLRSEANLTPALADRAMRDIALGAILQRPLYYLQGSLEMFWRMFAGRPVRLRQDWQPWRGIQWEERVGHLLPAGEPPRDDRLEQTQAIVSLYDPARWPLVVAALLLAGWVAAALRPDRWLLLFPAAGGLGLLLASAFLVGIEWRYRYPIDPTINVYLAGGLTWLLARLASMRPASRPTRRAGRAERAPGG